MSKEIQELMTLVAGGDMSALGELYDMLSPRVFNYARTITGNKELAEDITQDVFLRINKQASRLAKMTNPLAYIMVIARNHSYNLLKSGRRAAPLEDALDMSGDAPHYEHLIFEDAFSGLPPTQRETVYLHLVCGFSHKEAAKLQKAPLVTVKWRYGKALNKLRTYFTQDEKIQEKIIQEKMI